MTTRPHRVRNLLSNERLYEVQQLFERHIPARYKPLPVFDSEHAPRFDAHVAGVIDDGNIIGAIYWTRNFEDEFQLLSQDLTRQAQGLNAEVRVLQNIAVEPGYRGQGIAASLIDHMEGRLRAQGITSLIGVATGDAGPYFSRQGFYVYEPGRNLRIALPSVRSVVTIPIEGEDVRWFAKALT